MSKRWRLICQIGMKWLHIRPDVSGFFGQQVVVVMTIKVVSFLCDQSCAPVSVIHDLFSAVMSFSELNRLQIGIWWHK
jgi:hypothetical protein